MRIITFARRAPAVRGHRLGGAADYGIYFAWTTRKRWTCMTAPETSHTSLGRPVLYALVLLGLYLTYLILAPFFVALTWAVLLAILFRRMQVTLAPKLGPNGAAVATTLTVGVLIVTPAALLVSALAREAPQLTDYVTQASQNAPRQIQHLWDAVRARSPMAMPENPSEIIATGVQRTLAFLAPRAGAFVVDLFGTLGTLAATLFALFFMLRDGEMMRSALRDRLPFSGDANERLLTETRDLVMASVGASLVVAAAQGAIGGVAFWLLGIGAPVFWGVATAFCSLLPLGAGLVWVPAAIWLLLSGDIGRAVIMLIVGAFGISMIDNLLRPLILSGKTSVSGFVVFFGLLGGAAAFGFIGLVIGPIILVVTSRLLENLHHPDRLPAS
jgi:predicted PurR-regulated permease PerM